MFSLENVKITNEKSITWEHSDILVVKEFNLPIFQIIFSKLINSVIIIADYREVGSNNMYLYNLDGTLKVNPCVPALTKSIQGIYSMWYVEGHEEQTVVLITGENTPYETKCIFNLKDYSFSKFSPTK